MTATALHSSHELAITKIIDGIAVQGRLQPTAIPEIVAHLDFTMSRNESGFLVRYIIWRMDNPEVREAAFGITPR
jgi:hypothetical protein